MEHETKLSLVSSSPQTTPYEIAPISAENMKSNLKLLNQECALENKGSNFVEYLKKNF